MSSKISYNAAA